MAMKMAPVVLEVEGTQTDGKYELVPDCKPNGMPLWKWTDGESWIFSGTSGHWLIGDEDEQELDFECDNGNQCSTDPHEGSMPHCMDGDQPWQRLDPTTGVWIGDSAIKVLSLDGQKKDAWDEGVEGDGHHVEFGSPGNEQLAVRDVNMQVRVPAYLFVTGVKRFSGMYELVRDKNPTGYPIWKRENTCDWIYSSKKGRWIFGDESEAARNFLSDTGNAASSEKHGGRLPHEMPDKKWLRYDGDEDGGSWMPFPELTLYVYPESVEHGSGSRDVAPEQPNAGTSKANSDAVRNGAATAIQKTFRGNRARKVSAWATDLVGGEICKVDSTSGKIQYRLGQRDLDAATKHLYNVSAGVYKQYEACDDTGTQRKKFKYAQRSYFGTSCRNLKDFGTGVQLHFTFARDLACLLFLICLVMSAAVVANYRGEALQRIVSSSATSEDSFAFKLAMTSVANLGRWESMTRDGEVVKTAQNVTMEERRVLGAPIERWTFVHSWMDFSCVMLLLLFVLQYRNTLIPKLVHEQQVHIASLEDWTVFIDCLPRRLPGDDHYRYAEYLKKHLENILLAEVNENSATSGQWVVSKHDPGFQGTSTVDEAGTRQRKGFDKKGRRLGVYLNRFGCHTAMVQWKNGKDEPLRQAEVVQTCDLLDHTLLSHLNHDGLDPDSYPRAKDPDDPDGPGQREKLIHSVSLVHDFGGLLEKYQHEHRKKNDAIAKEVRSRRKNGETVDLREIQKRAYGQLGKRSSDINRNQPPIADRDVIGAHVTFTRWRYKTFILNEFRFSSTIFRTIQPSRLNFFWHSIRVTEAAPPSDIIWANMDYSYGWRILRTFLMACILMTLVSSVIAILAYAKKLTKAGDGLSHYECQARAVNFTDIPLDYLNLTADDCGCVLIGQMSILSDRPQGSYDLCRPWVNGKLKLELVRFGGAMLTAIVGAAIGPVSQALANFNRPTSKTEMNYNVMLMTALFQIINLGVIPIIVNADFMMPEGLFGLGKNDEAYAGIFGLFGDGEYRDLVPDWYVNVGGAMMLALLTNSFSAPLAGITQAPMFWLKKKLFKGTVQLRKDLIDLHTPPDFPMPIRAGQALSACFVCVSLASPLPLLWPFAFVAIFLFFWTDKLSFLYGSKLPPRYAEHLTQLFLKWMQIAILLHGSVGLFAYGNTAASPSWSLSEYSEGKVRGEELKLQLPEDVQELTIVEPLITLKTAIVHRAQVASAFPQFLLMVVMILIYLLRFSAFTFGSKFIETLSLGVQALAPGCSARMRHLCGKRTAQGKTSFSQSSMALSPDEEEPQRIIDEPVNGKPMREMRKKNRLTSYDIVKTCDFKFLDQENKRWRMEQDVKRNRALGLTDDGQEVADRHHQEHKQYLLALDGIEAGIEADADDDAAVRLGMKSGDRSGHEAKDRVPDKPGRETIAIIEKLGLPQAKNRESGNEGIARCDGGLSQFRVSGAE